MPVYTIEVAGRNNENLIFNPLRARLRGRWDTSRVAHRDCSGDGAKQLRTIAQIPGIHISVDTDAMMATVSDPLATTPEGKIIWERITSIIKQHKREFGGEKKTYPTETVNLRESSEGLGLKYWLHEMAKVVRGKDAVMVPGSAELPPIPAILSMPGKIPSDPGNTGRQEKDLQKWAHEVPHSKQSTDLFAGPNDNNPSDPAGPTGGNDNSGGKGKNNR